MFAFRLRMLERCIANNETLGLWEISTLFKRRTLASEMAIDIDAALDFYIEVIVPEGERDDLRQEPLSAESDMLEAFNADLIAMVRHRQALLGDHYPFELDQFRKLVLKETAEITAVGAAYLSLQFFRLWHAELVEIEEQDIVRRRAKRLAFSTWFPRMFEMVAGYAVAGHRNGVPHMTSHCRSSQRLNRMLGSLCVRLQAGRVRGYADWSEEQLASNDGGVDVVVHAGGPGMPGHAHLILVGATIQNAQIQQKIVGPEARTRFRDYFAAQPAAFYGALVRPYELDYLTLEKCRTRDCLLYSFEEVVESIGVRSNEQHALRYYAGIDGSVRRQARKVDGAVMIDEFDQYVLSIP